MTISGSILLVLLLGAVVGGGIFLLVDSLIPRVRKPGADSGESLVTWVKQQGRRLPGAVIVGLLALVLTGWIVAGIAVGLLVFFWGRLFGGNREEKNGVARAEALAAWTESLRDVVAGAVGLEQAIPATTHAAAPSIAPALQTLSDRLRVRVPLADALQRFAEEMDDAAADLIIAALILNARLRGPGLRDVLSSLATTARAELEMRQRINAGRRSTRRSVQIVVGVTILFVVGLAIFNRSYVEPYNSTVGQVVLVVIAGFFAAGIAWLRNLSKFEQPERFLTRRAPGDAR